MKVCDKSKIIFLFISLCVFASAAVAQEEKPQPIYIGEYLSEDGSSAFERMTEQLIFRLKQEPTTSRGIIGIVENGVLGEKAKAVVSKHPKLKNEILFGFGKEKSPRPEHWVHFWIVPLGAEIPDLGCRIPICVCPTVSVSGFKSIDAAAEELIFTGEAEGGSEERAKYIWKLSAGKIIEGQGTLTIKVDAEGAKEIRATLEVEGMCDECPRTAEFTTKIQ